MRQTAFAFLVIALLAGCRTSAPVSQAPPRAEEPAAPLLDGLGDHHMPITTASERAQRFFDQGLTLAYGFNHAEAARAFREAQRLDPACAMCHWGEALVLGPNINAPMPPENAPKAWAALQEAQRHAGRASEREQAYVRALAARYAADPPEDRSALDAAYAEAMRTLAQKYSADFDAKTLFAEALMDTTPWDYWQEDGAPKPVTREMLATLDTVLKQSPKHPGANHYYIHAVEAVHPERGEPMADRLDGLVPGAGHLVHMPSHIYVRVGRYHDAVRVNQRASAADERYIAQCRAQGFYPLLYYPHNLHFLWFSAMMGGEADAAIAAAEKIQANLSDDMIQSQHLRPTLVFALVRFGRWDAILDLPAPPPEQLYARAMHRYGRGLARLHTGDAAAQAELAELTTIARSKAAQDLEQPFFYGLTQARIAHRILQGEVAGARGQADAMIEHLRAAVKLQDGLPYMEPPYWYYPVRQPLGAALLRAERPAEAEAVYREDLAHFAENGWSLHGLAASLRAQGRTDDAQRVRQRFEQAWQHADVTLSASF